MTKYTLIHNETKGFIATFERRTKIDKNEFVSIEVEDDMVDVYLVTDVINCIPAVQDKTSNEDLILLVEEI